MIRFEPGEKLGRSIPFDVVPAVFGIGSRLLEEKQSRCDDDAEEQSKGEPVNIVRPRGGPSRNETVPLSIRTRHPIPGCSRIHAVHAIQ